VARLDGALGVRAQVGLVAWLRWRLFRNSLRSQRAVADLIGLVAVALLFLFMTVGGAFGMAALGFAIGDGERMDWMVYPFWAVFLVWQFLPILTAAFSVEFNFRNLLRFPLRFPSFALLSLFYGLFDPAALMGLMWLVALTAGVLLARPELAPWMILVVPVFALMNLLLNRMVFSWLERLLAKRRAREIAFVVFLLAIFAFQGTMMSLDRWKDQAEGTLRAVMEWTRVLPPGLAGDVFLAADRGAAGAAFLSFLGLALYGALFGTVLGRSLRRQYRGEEHGESSTARPRAATPETLKLGWELPVVSGTVAALVEKEFRYMLRNGPVLLGMLTPLLLLGLITLAWTGRESVPGFLQRDPGMFLPVLAGFVVMVLAPMSYNSFAYDGRGVQMLLVAPVRFADVMLAKNITLGALLLGEVAVLSLGLALAMGLPDAALTVATLAAVVFAMLANFAVGNLLSLSHPRQFDFGKFRQRQAGLTVVATFAMQIVVFGTVGAVIGIARVFGLMWVAVLVLFLFAGGSVLLYRWSLAEAETLAPAKRDVLTAELCRN
jgi:ABC-2 type transport system permease protein